MRYSMIAAALAVAAAGVAAHAEGGWGAFQDGEGSGVGLQAADGTQLLVKCDKPGKGSVFATVVTQTRLVPPGRFPVMRPVKVRTDTGTLREDRWRFFDTTASAVNTTTEGSLKRFLGELTTAQKVWVTLDPGQMKPIDIAFTVAGAKDAVAGVFTSCKDQIP